MQLFRRFLVLQSLMLWQGGFIFYASFVVPVGTELLGSAAEQGKITREVTNSLNIVGCVAILILIWDWLASRPSGRWFTFGLLLIMVITMSAMIWMHPRMEAFMDAATEEPFDRRGFRPWHRIYLWMSTVQWFATVLYSIWWLRSRSKDSLPDGR